MNSAASASNASRNPGPPGELAHRLQPLPPRPRIGTGQCGTRVRDGVPEPGIPSQRRREIGHGLVPPRGEHVLRLQQSDELVRIVRAHRIGVVPAELPDPMGQRNELVPVDRPSTGAVIRTARAGPRPVRRRCIRRDSCAAKRAPSDSRAGISSSVTRVRECRQTSQIRPQRQVPASLVFSVRPRGRDGPGLEHHRVRRSTGPFDVGRPREQRLDAAEHAEQVCQIPRVQQRCRLVRSAAPWPPLDQLARGSRQGPAIRVHRTVNQQRARARHGLDQPHGRRPDCAGRG